MKMPGQTLIRAQKPEKRNVKTNIKNADRLSNKCTHKRLGTFTSSSRNPQAVELSSLTRAHAEHVESPCRLNTS
jgi:hypothetical protein